MSPKRSTRRSERRRKPRADAVLSMRLEGEADGAVSGQLVTESQNISASGVYCTAGHYLAPLSKVALAIVLPRLPGSRAGELIKCDGIVVRCEPAGTRRSERNFQLACTFSGLDDRRRRLLEEFVTWRTLQSLRAAAGAAMDGDRPRTSTARRRAAPRAARPGARSGRSRPSAR